MTLADSGEHAGVIAARSIAEILTSQCEKQWTMAELATMHHVGKWHISRVFSKLYGKPPHRFLRDARLERAKHLLCTTDFSILEIQFMIGYNSQGSFSTMFHEVIGIPPKMYRRLGGVIPISTDTMEE